MKKIIINNIENNLNLKMEWLNKLLLGKEKSIKEFWEILDDKFFWGSISEDIDYKFTLQDQSAIILQTKTWTDGEYYEDTYDLYFIPNSCIWDYKKAKKHLGLDYEYMCAIENEKYYNQVGDYILFLWENNIPFHWHFEICSEGSFFAEAIVVKRKKFSQLYSKYIEKPFEVTIFLYYDEEKNTSYYISHPIEIPSILKGTGVLKLEDLKELGIKIPTKKISKKERGKWEFWH